MNVGPELQQFLSQDSSVLSYVAVRGRVKELGRTIDSSIGLKGVMHKSTVNEHSVRRHSFGHWRDTVRTISQTQNDVPFALKSIGDEKSKVIVEIITPFEAETESLLIPISTTFNPTSATAGNKNSYISQ